MAKKKSIVTEEELVVLLRRQDREVISILYDRYADALYGIIYKIVRSEPIAEDVLQEVYVKIWKNALSYDSTKGRLFTWLLNVARNLAIDRIRSKSYRNLQHNQSMETVADAVDRQMKAIPSPDHIGLRDLVGDLAPAQQMLVDMVFFRGYTHVEAAEELGIPLGTVKTRLRLAVGALRKVFDVPVIGQ